MRIVDHPALGRLSYPDEMSDDAIYQDIDNRILSAMKPQPKTSATGHLKEFAKGIIPGAAGFGEAAAKGIGGFYADLLKSNYVVGPGAQPVVSGIEALGKQVAESPVGKFFEPAPGYETAPKLGRAVGSVLGVAGSRILGPAAPLLTGAGAGAGEQYERAIEAKAPEYIQSRAALLGAGTGLTEAIPVEIAFARTMKLMPGTFTQQGLQIIRNAAITGGFEGAQEAAQNFLQNLIAKNLYKPDQELLAGVGEGAAYGAGAGAIFQTALDLTLGRKAMRGRRAEEAPPATEEAVPPATEQAVAPPAEKTARQAIREKQLAQGINVLDEEDLTSLGLPKGKTFTGLLGKDLSDPNVLDSVEKTMGSYLSAVRKDFNNISRLEKVLDKQIKGEELSLADQLILRNYNGEDVDAWLMSKLDVLKARAPTRELPAKEEKPKTEAERIKEMAAEQARIARQEMIERGALTTEDEVNALAKQREKEAKDALKAEKAGAKELKGLGITPTIPPTPEAGAQVFAGAQPDLFGEITTQGPEVTRGSSQEAEFMRQRAEFEDNLRQLNVAAKASVAGVPEAEQVVQTTAAGMADKINRMPFSIPELMDIRNKVVLQGEYVPGSESLIQALDRKIAELSAAGETAPEGQAELPFAETAQKELFEPAGPAMELPTPEAIKGLTLEDLQRVGLAANKIQQFVGKDINEPGVAEALREQLEGRVTNFRRQLDKAKRDYAALLGPEGVLRGKVKASRELEAEIADLEKSFAAAEENLRMFPMVEQKQISFDQLQPVSEVAFPTPTEQEEERRYQRIKADEARIETEMERGVASELGTRLPTSETVQEVEALIDRIRPLRGKVNNDTATPEQLAQYDNDLLTLYQMVKGETRIPVKFDDRSPAALALNRAYAKAEGFMRNLSKKERSRLAQRIVAERDLSGKRELATKVLGKQARREAEQFPEVTDEVMEQRRREREDKRRKAEMKSYDEQIRDEVRSNPKMMAAFNLIAREAKVRDQYDRMSLMERIYQSTDAAGNVDIEDVAKAFDVPVKGIKEKYLDQIATESKQKTESETRKAEEKKAEEEVEAEKKKVVTEEELRVKTYEEIRDMPAKSLPDLIDDIALLEGGKLQPLMQGISRAKGVSENLEKSINASFGEGEVSRRAQTEKELLEQEGRAHKVIKRKVPELKWEVYESANNYIVLKSGDNKFVIITPARFNAEDLVGSFRVRHPQADVTLQGSGTRANVKYATFTANLEARKAKETGPGMLEYTITPQALAQQKLAEKNTARIVDQVREEIGKATYKDLADGTTVNRLVEKFGIDRTVRALFDEKATRASQREKVGKFAMDDRVLDKAIAHLEQAYGVQVYFSDRFTRRDETPNVGFANEFLNKAGKESTDYTATSLLQTIARHEGNSDIGRTARVMLSQAAKFKLNEIPVFYNPEDETGSYFYNTYDKNGNRNAAIVIGKGHLYLPDVSLHEIIHSTTVEQMRKVQDPEYKRTGARWEDAALGLIDLHRFMEFYVNDKVSMGSWANLSKSELDTLKTLKEQYGMKNAREFVAEALSDEEFKALLKKIPAKEFVNWIKQYQPAKADERRLTMFEKLVKGARNVYEFFTRLLRQALNLPDSSQTVFDLTVNQFGKLIQQSTPASFIRGKPNEVTVTAKEPTPKKYGRDPLPADIITILDNIKNNPALNVPVVKGKADAERAVKTGLLPLMTVNQLRDVYGSDPRLKELSQYYETTQRLAGYRNDLRQRYGDVLNDFYKVTRAHKNLKDKLYEVINEGSRLEVDVLKPNKDYTDPAIKADHARLQAIYNSFPQDIKDFYSKYRKNNDYILDQIKESMANRAASYVSDPDAKAEIRAMVEKKIDSFKEKGPYAPLMFLGNNWVNVQTAEDNILPFSFETKTQADEFAKQMKAKGYGVKQFESIKELKAAGAPRAGFFKQLEKVLDRNRVNPKAKDEIYQMTLMYLPEESFMRQFQNRKGAPSYERDALRNYMELADRVVHQLPKARYLPDMDQALEAMKAKVKQDPDDTAGRVIAELEKNYQAASQPKMSEFATFLGNLGFGWYMGANPSSAIVQLFQIPTMTVPFLGTKYGINPTISELSKASKDFFGGEVGVKKGIWSVRTNPRLTDVEKKGLQELYDLNVIPPAATEVGDFETMTNLKAVTKTERALKKVNGMVGYLFQNAERFNREVTALAAFRLEYARSKNFEKAVQAANDAVVETQGDYSDLNAPRVFKHPYAKVALMFKKFAQLVIYQYARNAQIYMDRNNFTAEERRMARNRLAGMTGMAAMFSGVTGMPFYWLVEAIMNAFGDDDDPYYDFTTNLRQTMPEWVVSGVPSALTGANFQSRIGLQDVPLIGFMPGIGKAEGRGSDARSAVGSLIEGAAGPLGGILVQTADGYDQITQGNTYRGIEKMVPSAIRNFMKSYRFGTEGATTLRGDPLGVDVDSADVAVQALGFAPLSVAKKQEENYKTQKLLSEIDTNRTRLYTMLNLAIDAGDFDMADDVMEKISKFNDKYPGAEISDKDIAKSVKQHEKRKMEMVDGVYIPPKLRPYLEK